MTSEEIKTHVATVMPVGDIAFWMREIAYQLAVRNERSHGLAQPVAEGPGRSLGGDTEHDWGPYRSDLLCRKCGQAGFIRAATQCIGDGLAEPVAEDPSHSKPAPKGSSGPKTYCEGFADGWWKARDILMRKTDREQNG